MEFTTTDFYKTILEFSAPQFDIKFLIFNLTFADQQKFLNFLHKIFTETLISYDRAADGNLTNFLHYIITDENF